METDTKTKGAKRIVENVGKKACDFGRMTPDASKNPETSSVTFKPCFDKL